MCPRPALTFVLQRTPESQEGAGLAQVKQPELASAPHTPCLGKAVPQGHSYHTLQTNKVFYFVYFNDSALQAASSPPPLKPPPWLSTSVWERRLQKNSTGEACHLADTGRTVIGGCPVAEKGREGPRAGSQPQPVGGETPSSRLWAETAEPDLGNMEG